MILPVFIAATVAIDALAIVFLVRGLRATTRPISDRYAGRCLGLAVIVALGVVAGKVAATAASFASVSNAEKAAQLSEHIGSAMTMQSFGVPAALLPVVFAVLVLARGRRLPPSG